ncbi:hypothetical protein [Malonomonas rubra]|uniref:hypothetical protein n=1 Tax=Malonomonas rubra TaxID=57040 RepID=UPI0026EC168A|nr:hypothetical protein [Malonomonas rubra]
MAKQLTINLSIDSSLVDYFIQAGHEDEDHVADCLVDFFTSFLNDTRWEQNGPGQGRSR